MRESWNKYSFDYTTHLLYIITVIMSFVLAFLNFSIKYDFDFVIDNKIKVPVVLFYFSWSGDTLIWSNFRDNVDNRLFENAYT